MRKRTIIFATILILVVVTPILVMVGLGVMIDRQRGREADLAFAPIKPLGGTVWAQAIPFERYGHYVVEFPPESKLSDGNVSQLASLNALPDKNTLDLVIQSPKVTDRSLPDLKAIRTLDGLDVAKTSISDQGIDELRQALPQTTVKDRGSKDAEE